MDDFDRRFDRAFGLVAFAANRHLVEHMRRITANLKLDLETTLIWGLLAQLNVAPQLTPGVAIEQVLGPDGFLIRSPQPVRLADLTAVSALPRETVRRKLEKLRRLGKAERTEDGRWHVTRSGVDPQTYEFTRETVKRLLQTARQIEGILQQVE